LNAALYGSGVDFVDPAVVDVTPSTIPLRYAAAASMLGLLIAVAVAWVRAGWHRTIDESDQASALLGAPLLGDVPDLGGPDQRELVTDPTAMPAAAFQALTAGLLARRPAGGVILVTGLTRGDGSTITAVSVAIGLAREGRNVVLVDGDADVRSARSLLGAVRGPGLAEVARGLDDESVVQSVGIGGGSRLSFVSAGGTREDLPGVYRSDGTKRALAGLALAHDLVLVDAPPLLESAETASLALHANAVLVVVRRRTRVRTLESFRSRLAVYSVPVVGIVFNRNRSKVHGGERARDLEDVLEEREEKPALERRAAIHPT
jgi:Mrp family chromosome partitioning ATPase